MERFVLFIASLEDVVHLIDGLKKNDLKFLVTTEEKEIEKVLLSKRPALIVIKDEISRFSSEEWVEKIAHMEHSPHVIVFSDRADALKAKKFLDLGAWDFWISPLILDKILVFFRSNNRCPSKEVKSTTTKSTDKLVIIGEHKKIKIALALAKKVAPSDATVLISGESGTGKELIAKYIHVNSNRAMGPYVAVNCAALPENLLESELFGYEKGAFTGAYKAKPGKFELASGGTILLDEISEMNLNLQAKLLRVIQEKEVDRLGGVSPIKVDVRIIATTNRNLKEYVEQGNFRQDLYFRLNVIPIHLPPLRERGDDVVLLARYFLGRFCQEYGIDSPGFSDRAIAWLKSYEWPGNIRELENLVERAVLIAHDSPIEPRHFLLDELENDLLDNKEKPVSYEEEKKESGEFLDNLQMDRIVPLEDMEKQLIIKSLEKTRGNRTKAAELLGISVRTLRNKLNKLKEQGIIL